MDLGTAVRIAQADAAVAEGRLREPFGGGAAEVRDARLMASGLPFAKWNRALVTGPDPDLAAAHEWFRDKRVPWAVRVPVDLDVTPGRYLFRQRCMAVEPSGFRAAAETVAIRRAGPVDVDRIAHIDAVAFGDDAANSAAWFAPQLRADRWDIYAALVDDEPVGVATGVRTDDRAGPAVLVAAVGVLPAYRGGGIGTALSSRVVRDAFAGGIRLAHLNPDTDAASRIYARLGFVEVPGFDIYEDCDA